MTLGLVAALVTAVFLPRALAALPGRVRQYLPEAVAVQTVPPLPTPQVISTVDPAFNPVADMAVSPSPVAAGTRVSEAEETKAADAPTPPPTLTATVLPNLPTAAPPLPASVYLEGVTIIPQKFNNCGPANLSMVLAYHGVALDQLAIAAEIRPTYEDRNVSPEELAAFVTAQTGLAADVIVGSDIDLLKQLLAAGLPLIVEQGLEQTGDAGWMGHYLTLYGYDDTEASFYTRDTFLGPWQEDGRESYASVLEDWKPFNYLVVVVYPDEKRATVEEILTQRLADPATMWAMAVDKARADVRADGSDPFAWFNLGTSLTRLHQLTGDMAQLQQAVASFDQARLIGLPGRMLWYQFTPYEAYLASGRTADVLALTEATLDSQGGRSVEETYVYRAMALRAQGDEEAAARELSQAMLLHPENPVVRRALANQP